ncbi:unnamed protein product [Durusdinium trenchii]
MDVRALVDSHQRHLIRLRPGRVASRCEELKKPNRSEDFSALLPMRIVEDETDFDTSEEMEHRSSYNTMRWPLPVSDHHVPMPPNRSSHDHHLLQLHVYMGKIQQDPHHITRAAQIKLGMHELRLELAPSPAPPDGPSPKHLTPDSEMLRRDPWMVNSPQLLT